MKIVCPNNPKHKRFIATAHVTEDWVVDDDGNFQEVWEGSSGETTHKPDSQDCFTCLECQSEATAS